MLRNLIQALPFFGFGAHPINLLGHPYALSRTALKYQLACLAPLLSRGPLLDVGCGTMPYKSLFSTCHHYHGLEIRVPRHSSNKNITYFYDGGEFPIPNSSYSSVLCSQVLEHSFNPELLLSECSRILSADGSLLLTCPFVWPEHEQPYDSQRYTSYGILNLLERSGFKVLTISKLNPGLSAIIQLSIHCCESFFSSQLSRCFPSPMLKPLYLIWRLICLPAYAALNCMGLFYRYCFCRSSLMVKPQDLHLEQTDFYLDLVILAVKTN